MSIGFGASGCAERVRFGMYRVYGLGFEIYGLGLRVDSQFMEVLGWPVPNRGRGFDT